MDCVFFEEDEQYQTQCGEMFFTTKGRIIFHCTLCEMKFQGFDSFEVHIKEHIPVINDGHMDDIDGGHMDDIEQPQCEVEYYEHEFEESADPNDSQLLTTSFIKEEHDVIGEALQEQEISLTEIKQQSRLHFKSGIRFKNGQKQNKTNAISKKPKQLPTDQNTTSKSTEKKQKGCSNEEIEIPAVVREVQSRVHPRSLLTPAEERKFKCPVCGVAFKDRHNMVHHLKRHSDNKDHKCPECDKRFYTATEVRIHMRSHKDERPFLCNICGRAYVSNSHLLEHLKRHSNQRNHKCEVCHKAFFSKTQLMGHMAGHSNERPFACEICAASFTRRKALINHMKLHENKREFKCEFCDSGFNQRAGLFSHMKTAHKGD